MPHKNIQLARQYQKRYQRKYRHFIKTNKRKKRDFLDKKICSYCKETYDPANAQQKFCSHNCRSKAYYKNNPNRQKSDPKHQRKSSLKRLYNIQPADYDKLLGQQNGLCAICGQPETRKNRYGGICKLHIDHDHKTKKIRGLLCGKCNSALGLFKDNKKLLKKAIKYLD